MVYLPRYGTPEYEEFRADWMQAHSGHVTQLMADRPEIAFYAPNCREHGIGMGESVTVREQERVVNETSLFTIFACDFNNISPNIFQTFAKFR